MTERPGQKEFFEFRPILLEYIKEISIKCPEKELNDYFSYLVDYTTDGGKCHRGLLSVYGFLELTGYDPNSKEAWPGYALGWVQEILQASFLVADDLMDKSELRRGKPCWYLVQKKKYVAVSDTYFLENVLYMILDHFFEGYDKQTIYDIKKLLHETTLRTAIGQYIDMKKKEPTIENWVLTVTSKTAYYSIWQPFVSGMVASRKIPREIWNNADLKKALLHAGVLFQCQDDWLDLYAGEATTKKTSCDIPDGKLSWLYAKANELATEEEKVILRENIGKHDKECIDRVVQIYEAHNLKEVQIQAMDEAYSQMKEMFSKLDPAVPRGVLGFLEKFLDRRKY